MKLSVFLLLLNAITVYGDGISEGLNELDAVQAAEGPSLELLNRYDTLIKEHDSEPLVYKAYEKMGLIQLFLNRESQTMESFEKSLELNPQNAAVKKNLFELYFKFGYQDKFNKITDQLKLTEDDALVKEIKEKFRVIDSLVERNDLDAAINLSPHNPRLRSLRVTDIIDRMPQENYTEQQKHFSSLIDDYLNLIKSASSSNTPGYLRSLSQIYVFNKLEIKNANVLLKKCLQYDIEDKSAINTSKFLNRYSSILEKLDKYKTIFQGWNENDEIQDLQDIDEVEISEIIQELKDKRNFIKIRRANDMFDTNLAFLISLSHEFSDHFKVSNNVVDLTILNLELLHNLKNKKVFKTLSAQLIKADKSQENSLPILIYRVDEALKSNDYAKVHELLKHATKNMRKSKLIKSRLEKLHAYQRKQQQQQQQQQRQQQSQQHSTPKNDYYKILEVPKSASQTEIRKAYREMTKQYHPDKYKGDLSKEETEHKMTQINHAYEVLSDERTRKDYDNFGDDPNDAGRQNGRAGAGGQQFRYQGNPFGGQSGQFAGSFGGFNFGGFQSRNARARPGKKARDRR